MFLDPWAGTCFVRKGILYWVTGSELLLGRTFVQAAKIKDLDAVNQGCPIVLVAAPSDREVKAGQKLVERWGKKGKRRA